MLKKRITIFTPTFNRGHTLPKLYKSLIKQTSKDFIWLIVDDGSTDNTKESVERWISENNIEIVYHKQINQGKPLAHNKGVSMTKTELFTCVDSDDYLSKYAIEEVLEMWEKYKRDISIIGILAFKGNYEKKFIVQPSDKKLVSTTLRDGYRKHGLKGDMFLIYRTDNLIKYIFPKFEGENFVPEAYLYDLLDQDGELLILNKVLYYYEYLDDGYTSNMAKLLFKNPKGYIYYIRQRLSFDVSLKDKVLDSIKYIAICISSKEKIDFKIINNAIILFCYPMGYILYLKKFKKFKGI